MKKIRMEFLENFTEFMSPEEVAKLAFEQIDKSISDIFENCGLKIEPPDVVILNEIEYSRK